MIRGYLALVLFAVSVTACAPPPEESCSASVAEGYALPAATIADCSGAEVKLSELTAAHDVTYITFAAGWCTASA